METLFNIYQNTRKAPAVFGFAISLEHSLNMLPTNVYSLKLFSPPPYIEVFLVDEKKIFCHFGFICVLARFWNALTILYNE